MKLSWNKIKFKEASPDNTTILVEIIVDK